LYEDYSSYKGTVYAKLKCPKTDGIACPDIAGI
jgi:hypothetical protein